MNKRATTVEEQIIILKCRRLIVDDEAKAKEQLLDIGYYRLGFYFYSFEKSPININNRTHEFVDGVKFSDIIELYYFDNDLKNILIKYLTRIEVNFRTKITYLGSIKYKDDPVWFSNTKFVTNKFVNNFKSECYSKIIKNKVIKFHHEKYPNDIYAPAWKTLEFMTFGNIFTLYHNIIEIAIKQEISSQYGCKNIKTFESYIETIRLIRNACAHGACLYSINLSKSIKSGPAFKVNSQNRNNICGAIQVILYILRQISSNKESELRSDLKSLFSNINSLVVKNRLLSLINTMEIFG